MRSAALGRVTGFESRSYLINYSFRGRTVEGISINLRLLISLLRGLECIFGDNSYKILPKANISTLVVNFLLSIFTSGALINGAVRSANVVYFS